jgi:hypothetical protein
MTRVMPALSSRTITKRARHRNVGRSCQLTRRLAFEILGGGVAKEVRQPMPRSAGARGIILLAGVLFGIFLAAASPAPAARTLFYWPTEIHTFAQDGPYIAWMASTDSVSIGRTYIRYRPTGRQRSFRSGGFIHYRPQLTLGRGRALWTAIPNICGNCTAERVFTASLGSSTVSRLGTFVDTGGGTQLTGLAADWRVRAFSFISYEENPVADCICHWDVTGGRTWQVLGGARRGVPGAAQAAVLAAGARRIAVAPANHWDGSALDPQPAENGPVNVLDPSTGTVVMSVSPTGTVKALALSAGALAALVQRNDGSFVIERYAIPTGTLVSTPVNVNVALEVLDIAGKWIVYHVGREIRIVDDLGGDRLLTVALRDPIGVSIEGRRVAWAENVGRTHRFRAAFTPR